LLFALRSSRSLTDVEISALEKIIDDRLKSREGIMVSLRPMPVRLLAIESVDDAAGLEDELRSFAGGALRVHHVICDSSKMNASECLERIIATAVESYSDDETIREG